MKKLYLFLIASVLSVKYVSCISDYDRKGQAFLEAVSYRDLDLTKNLLKEGADPLYTGVNPRNVLETLNDISPYATALFYAASNADYKMIAFLLSMSNPGIEKVKQSKMINVGTGVYYSDAKNKWEKISYKEDKYVPLEAVIIPDILSYSGPRSSGRLRYSLENFKKAKKDRVKAAFQLISQSEIDLKAGRYNVLSLAIRYGKYDKYEIAKMIIKKAVFNKQINSIINWLPEQFATASEYNGLPLVTAIKYEAPLEIIELLLKNGASPSVKGEPSIFKSHDKKSALEVVKNKLEELKEKVKNNDYSRVDYIAHKLGINIGLPGEINRFKKILNLFEAKIKKEEK